MSSLLESLDLNIQNYSINDIERFFRLSNTNYSSDMVELKEAEIRQQLLRSGHINKKYKRDLIFFLEDAKKWLISEKCSPPPKATSIPSNFRLDPTPTLPVPSISGSIGREQELINNPIVEYTHISSGNGKNDFFRGWMNPIEKRIHTVNLCIDTLFRKNYTSTCSSDFIYHLPKVLNNVVSMKLTSMEFPRVWNVFSTKNNNNTMTIYLYNMNGFPDSSYNILIPDGNYTQITFANTLNNIFNVIGNGLDFLWCEIQDITLSTVIRARNKQSEKCSGGPFPFDPSSKYYSPDFCFSIDFSVDKNTVSVCNNNDTHPHLYKNLGWMLGFRKRKYNVTPNDENLIFTNNDFVPILYKGYLRSESFFGSTIDNYVFLEIDDFHNNFPTDSIISSIGHDGNYIGKNILGRITLTSGPNTIINDNGSDKIFKERQYYGPVNLEKFKIRLLNRFNDVIDLNINDYSLTLEIKQLYSSG